MATERIENTEALVEVFGARGLQLQPYDGGGEQALGLHFLPFGLFRGSTAYGKSSGDTCVCGGAAVLGSTPRRGLGGPAVPPSRGFGPSYLGLIAGPFDGL